MKKTERILFSILRSALGTEKLSGPVRMSPGGWRRLYRICSKHIVRALVYEELNVLGHNMPDTISKEWQSYCGFAAKRFDAQMLTLSRVSAVLEKEDVKLMVLKGLGLALTYPRPELRECGDIDIFCFGDFEKANGIIEEKGLSEGWYDVGKHRCFFIGGINVENHLHIIEGGKAEDCVGDKLMEMSKETEAATDARVPGLCFPGPEMGLLHLAIHTACHLADSGIRVRHLCDMAMFLKKNGKTMDWNKVTPTLENAGILHPTMLLIGLCRRYLGLDLDINISVDEKEERIVLWRILHPFEYSQHTSLPLRKFYRKVRMYRHRKSMYRLMLGREYGLTFLETFAFLRRKN